MIRPRNWLVPILRLTKKAKAFLDKKKEQSKKACREKINKEEE